MKTTLNIGAMTGSLLFLWGCQAEKQSQLGDALAGLTTNQQAQFAVGKQAFQRVFKPEDGLGPLFNANSCAQCHEAPVVGGVGDEIEIHASKFTPPDSCDPLFDKGGPVFQLQATPLLQAHGITNEPVPPDATGAGHRSTPPLFGFGLVDAIPEAEILANETKQARSGAGIHGHANHTIDGRVGRFGRKAFTAMLFDFNVGAYHDEMGITSLLDPVENTVDGVPVPPDTILGPQPNITTNEIEQTTTFVRFLAPPPPQVFTNYQDQGLARRGKDLFAELKCAVCHIPEMKTGASDIKALNYKAVALYSDLLVHDLGTNLADICLGDASPPEFRTELLWGLRFQSQFLHDGRAKTVQEAIELHGGEAQRAVDKFKALSGEDRKALLKFLDSI
ncbi:MAG TPA: di-heme oxidoredictase family protein [Verrucomicrobiae bacterium]|nr:di-heme oxidoredictase family protein [Verrucomicrobiae bacterium]